MGARARNEPALLDCHAGRRWGTANRQCHHPLRSRKTPDGHWCGLFRMGRWRENHHLGCGREPFSRTAELYLFRTAEGRKERRRQERRKKGSKERREKRRKETKRTGEGCPGNRGQPRIPPKNAKRHHRPARRDRSDDERR